MDMGTGSGAIGATIARLSSRRVVCVDISMDAIRVAEKNGRRQGVSDRLDLCLLRSYGGHQERKKIRHDRGESPLRGRP